METIYIITYHSHEDNDAYAFRDKSKAVKDVEADFHNTINILKSQGYPIEITAGEDDHKELYVPGTGIYHEWFINESTLE